MKTITFEQKSEYQGAESRKAFTAKSAAVTSQAARLCQRICFDSNNCFDRSFMKIYFSLLSFPSNNLNGVDQIETHPKFEVVIPRTIQTLDKNSTSSNLIEQPSYISLHFSAQF